VHYNKCYQRRAVTKLRRRHYPGNICVP